MIWIPAALIMVYTVFIFAPAVVAVCTIFRDRRGADLERMIAPGAQLAPYAERILAAKTRLETLPKTEVEIPSEKGTLTADYYDLGAAKTAIFAHGYRTEPEVNFTVQAEAFARHGYNLLVIRQYGQRNGSDRSGMGLTERRDVDACGAWALRREGVSETVLYGISMGAAAVGFAACDLDQKRTRALILDCGFRSPDEQIALDCRRRHLPAFLMMPPIRLLAKLFYRLDIRERTDAALARTAIPCFFLHGTADATVPYETGREVWAACGAKKTFFTAEGAGHTESFLSDPKRAEDAIFTFLAEERTEGNNIQEDK